MPCAKTTLKPAEAARNTKNDKGLGVAAESWLASLSVETTGPVPLTAQEPGQRHLEITVQQQVVPFQQGDLFVQQMRLTVRVLHQRNLLALAECLTCMAHYVRPEGDTLRGGAPMLFERARTVLQAALQSAGHQPPLPATLAEVELSQVIGNERS